MGKLLTKSDWQNISLRGLVFILLLNILGIQVASKTIHHRITSDSCDWNGSGLAEEGTRANDIKPVNLRCREGRVSWKYPKGALRLVLRTPDHQDFYACFLLRSNTARASVYIEGLMAPWPIFGNRRLQCVRSKKSQILVFVAAHPVSNFLRSNLVEFAYDLEPFKTQQDECRPCSEKELLYHFCTADYVARGTVSSIRDDQGLQQTELTVRATEVLRDAGNRVFSTAVLEQNSTVQYGLLRRSLDCGTKAGQGEFLFVGSWRLGGAKISCAPRWAEWSRVKRETASKQYADCEIS